MENQTSQVLTHLKTNDPEHRNPAIQYALNHQPEVAPLLLKILENVLSNPNDFIQPLCDGTHSLDEPCPVDLWKREHSSWIHLYAVMLLAEFKESKAHSLILQLFSLSEDVVDDLFGDLVTDELSYILYSTFAGSPEGIQALIRQKDADLYVRASAVDALALLVVDQKLDRSEVLDFLSSLFEGNEAEEDSEFWGFIAGTILTLYPAEKMDIIESAYQRGLIADFIITLSEFKETVRTSSIEECLKDLKEELDETLKQTFEERIDWFTNPISDNFFLDEDFDEDDFLDDDFEAGPYGWNTPYVREEAKIGRNELCPCGSGKKYKKCCLT
jgi:hypothetical protein